MNEIITITLLSLRVSLTAVLISSIIAIPFAMFLAHKKFIGKKLVVTLIHTGMATPPVVVGLFVFLAFSRSGPLGALSWLYSPEIMIFAQMLMAIPIITGVSLAAINGVRQKTRETIIALGATKFQRMLKTIKEARYGIITALITSFGAAISEVGAIMIVGGNIRNHTRALTTSIVLETRKGNFGFAITLGIILLALAFIINFALTYVQQKNGTSN